MKILNEVRIVQYGKVCLLTNDNKSVVIEETGIKKYNINYPTDSELVIVMLSFIVTGDITDVVKRLVTGLDEDISFKHMIDDIVNMDQVYVIQRTSVK